MKKITTRIATLLIVLGVVAAATTRDASSDTVTNGPGLSRVTHNNDLAGSGTTTAPLTLTTRCTATQILKWSGSAWSCAADNTGSTLTAGSGITILSDVVAIDPTYTQRRVSGTCSAPESIRVIAQDGSVTCTSGTGDITGVAVAVGGGLTGGGPSGSVTVGMLTTCGTNEILKWSGSAWACAADAGTTYSAGTNLTLATTTFSLNPTISLAGASNTHTVAATNTATGQTSSVTMLRAGNNGSATFNTTAGALSSIAISGSSTSTKSAGANALTNYGGYFNASGADTNYSVYADGGLFQVNGAASFASTLNTTGNLSENTVRVATVAGNGMTKTGGTFDVVPRSGGGLTVGVDDVSMITTCGANEILKWVSSVWTCAADANSGTITAVVAGNGLTGGGSSGSVTVDVACATGMTCNANDIAIAARDFGDITTTSSGSVWTIDAGVVTLAQMANIATARFIGRTTASTGVPEALTGTQATAMLDAVTTSVKGLVPTAPNDTTKFFRGDATWAVPPDVGAPVPITAALTANVNDWSPSGFSGTTSLIDITSSTGGWGVTGISASGRATGSRLTITNNSGNTQQFVNESGSSSSANRIRTQTGFLRSIGNYGSITLIYVGSYWVEEAESTRYNPELYSLGDLNVSGNGSVSGNMTVYANMTLGDSSSDQHLIWGSTSIGWNGSTSTLIVDQSTVTTVFYGRVRDGGTAPTPSTCGTGPAVTGGTFGFRVVPGTGSTTSCTLTFATSLTVTPSCTVATEHATTEAYISAISASAMTITGRATTNLANTPVDVHCIGDL